MLTEIAKGYVGNDNLSLSDIIRCLNRCVRNWRKIHNTNTGNEKCVSTLSGDMKGRNHLGDLTVYERILLEWILKWMLWREGNWICLAQDDERCQVVVDTATNIFMLVPCILINQFFLNCTNRCTRSITKLILKLKLLRHVSVFLHHPKGALDLCQLKLWIIKMIKYNTLVWRYGKIVSKSDHISA